MEKLVYFPQININNYVNYKLFWNLYFKLSNGTNMGFM